MHTTKTYEIYWLPSGYQFEGFPGSDTSYENLTTRFLTDLGGSSYYNIVSQYYDRSNGSVLDASTFGGSYLDTNPYPSNTPSGQEIANEVLAAMRANGWTAGLNHLFLIFTASGIYSNAATDYCAFHTYTYSSNSQPVVYAYIPDFYSLTSYGIGCTLQGTILGLSPNLDPWADAAISSMSHEIFEAVTDPLLNAWGTDESEIGDRCNTAFGPLVNALGADIELKGHYYRVQEEWSNYNDGCVLQFGPGTEVQVNLFSSSGARPGTLNLTYSAEGIQRWTMVATGETSSATILADSGSTIAFAPTYAPGDFERFCLSASCQLVSYNVGTGGYLNLYCYDLLSQEVELGIQGGGNPSIVLNYVTAPPTPGSSDSQTSSSIQLSQGLQTIWVERGTTMSTPPSVGTSDERWATTQDAWSTLSSSVVPVAYYHQYLVDFSYSVVGGGSAYSTPVVDFDQFSSSSQTPVGQSVWADAG